jgi:hypothetical protein
MYPTRTPETVQTVNAVVLCAYNRRIIFNTHNTKRNPSVSTLAFQREVKDTTTAIGIVWNNKAVCHF